MTLNNLLPLIAEYTEVQLIDLSGEVLEEGHYDGRNSIEPAWSTYDVHSIHIENGVLYITLEV